MLGGDKSPGHERLLPWPPWGDPLRSRPYLLKGNGFPRLRPLCGNYHAVIHEAVVALVFVERELGFDLYTGKAGISY